MAFKPASDAEQKERRRKNGGEGVKVSGEGSVIEWSFLR